MITLDREESSTERRARERTERKAESDFHKVHNAASSYGATLRRYARQINEIIEAFQPRVGLFEQPALLRLREALAAYAAATRPWAGRVAARMVTEANRRNLTAWRNHTKGLSQGIRLALQTAPIGTDVAALLDVQVNLITSLPIEAGQWVHEQALGALPESSRYAERTAIESGWRPEEGQWRPGASPRLTELGRKLARANPDESLRWLLNRSTLIARTETARVNSVLTQVRAEHVGSTHYVWKTSGDDRVRQSHHELDNTVQAWSDPPYTDPPDHHSHPGGIFNCRCVSLPIIGG